MLCFMLLWRQVQWQNIIMVGSTGPTPPRLPTTMSDNDLFRERSGTLWNFVELYIWGKSSGTLWNFIMGLMERNNYDFIWLWKHTSTIHVCNRLFYDQVDDGHVLGHVHTDFPNEPFACCFRFGLLQTGCSSRRSTDSVSTECANTDRNNERFTKFY